ncbi:MAG: hypothetical protein E6G92_12345 [Alphaproteobacteria bacterium]|jgi:hypothetical protein|nr:MAG: hypothetical protein E6G92_12345 [Alphaproteobacteria bacterium]
MRKLILAAVAAATALPAGAASAQYFGGSYGYYGGQNRVRAEQRECQRELRRADSRREYNRELRECRREIARAQAQAYGYNYGNAYGNAYRYAQPNRYWDGYRWRYGY